jgi:hypothetical protein
MIQGLKNKDYERKLSFRDFEKFVTKTKNRESNKD